jgi:CHAT domain-containing protein/tetratricopeptide (TPR) repeat protein
LSINKIKESAKMRINQVVGIGFIVFIYFLSSAYQATKSISELHPFINLRIKEANGSNYVLLEKTLQEVEDKFNIETDTLALLYHSIGAACFNSRLEFKALEYYKKALEIRLKILPPNDYNLTKTFQGYGRTLGRVRRLDESLYYLEKNLKIREATLRPKSDSIAEASMIHGLYQIDKGDYNKAKELIENAISIFQFNLKDSYRLAYSYQYLGNCHYFSQQYSKAIDAYNKAIKIMDIIGNTEGISECSHNIGCVFRDEKQFVKAILYFEKAQKSNPHSEYLNNIANTYLELKQYPKAYQYINQALDFAAKNQSLCYYYIPRIYVTLGDIYAGDGKPNKAIRAYNQSIQLFLNEPVPPLGVRGLDPLSPEGIRDVTALHILPLSSNAASCRPDLLKVLRKKGAALNQLYIKTKDPQCLKVALANYQQCDVLLRDMLQGFSEENSRFFWTENVKDIYENGIRTALALKDNDAALAFAENSKAFNLLTELQNNRAKHFGGVPDALLEEEKKLRTNVAFWQKISFDPSIDSARMAQSREGLLKAKLDFEGFQKQLEKAYPNYFKLKYQTDKPLTIKDLQAKMTDNMAVVQYYLGDSSLFVFSVSKSNSAVLEKKITPSRNNRDFVPQQLFSEINDLRRSTGDYKFLKEKSDSAQILYLSSARFLYKNLLEGPLSILGKIERLRIIPDGALSYIPFEMLLTEDAASWRGDNTPWLLKRMAVSYAYSNRLLDAENGGKTEGNFGGYGISYEANKFFFSEAEKKNDKITPLKYTVEEVNNIQSMLNGKAWIDQSATKKMFLENAPKQGVIHLAMHGFLDPKDALNSGLIFSRNAPNDTTNYLTGYDLYAMELNTKLAVLSACNTGDGVLKGKEGIMSLARSFAFAGCQSLVMSLWSVPDKTTSDIMSHFYENLKNGMPKDVALQQAKLTHLSTAEPSRRVPNTWAAMILMGDIEPLSFAKWWQSGWLWSGVVVGFFGFVFFRKKMKLA